MAKVNLDKMSIDELKTLRKDVDKAITTFEKRRVAEAKKAVEEVAKKHGVSLDQLVGGAKKSKKQKSPAKYRNPANPSETWSGRGRQPVWYKTAIKGGTSPEKMEI